MSEQQASYDTDDTQPTPGPAWAEGTYVIASPNDGRPNGEVILGPRSYGNDISADEQRANARLCAAAFTAASQLPEGYDPLAAVEALPRLLDALQTIAKANGTRYAGTDALEHVAEKALDAIRTQPEIND